MAPNAGGERHEWDKVERAIGRHSEKLETLRREQQRLAKDRVEEFEELGRKVARLRDAMESNDPGRPGLGMRLDRIEQRQKLIAVVFSAVAVVMTLVFALVELWLMAK